MSRKYSTFLIVGSITQARVVPSLSQRRPEVVLSLRGQQRRLLGEVEDRVILPGCRRVAESGGFLTVGMAAAAVGAHFAGAKLVPRLRHVQHHAVPIERLEGEGRVGRDLRQETRVGIAVRIGRLPIAGELTHRNLAENPKPLVCMTEELWPGRRLDRSPAPSRESAPRGCRRSSTARRLLPG